MVKMTEDRATVPRTVPATGWRISDSVIAMSG